MIKRICLIILIASCLISCHHNTDRSVLRILVDFNNVVTRNNLSSTVNQLYSRLEHQCAIDPVKLKPWKDKAEICTALSDSVFFQISDLKIKLVRGTTGQNAYTGDSLSGSLAMNDNVATPNAIMMENKNDGSSSEAHRLKIILNDYRKRMIGLIYHKDSAYFRIGLLTSSKYNSELSKMQSWEEYCFNEMPLAADIATLTELEYEVRYCECSILGYLCNMTSGSYNGF